MRLDDPDRHPNPVPKSEAVFHRSAEAGEIVLQRGHPRFELATTLPTPMDLRLGIDNLANINNTFAGKTLHSMRESTKSTLKKYGRQSPKMELPHSWIYKQAHYPFMEDHEYGLKY